MEIKARISKEFENIELHVCNHELTEEVKGILSELHGIYDLQLAATDAKGDRVLLRPGDVVYFSASGQKVFAGTGDGVYTVNEKLYELEEALKASRFVRISKSEIVNTRMIRSMDLSVTGTIRITMKNGYETYVSRRNVAKIKEMMLSKK